MARDSSIQLDLRLQSGFPAPPPVLSNPDQGQGHIGHGIGLLRPYTIQFCDSTSPAGISLLAILCAACIWGCPAKYDNHLSWEPCSSGKANTLVYECGAGAIRVYISSRGVGNGSGGDITMKVIIHNTRTIPIFYDTTYMQVPDREYPHFSPSALWRLKGGEFAPGRQKISAKSQLKFYVLLSAGARTETVRQDREIAYMLGSISDADSVSCAIPAVFVRTVGW